MQNESVLGQGHWNGNNNTVDDIDRPGNVAIGLPGGTAPLRPLHLNGFFLFDSPTNFAIETGFGNLFMHNGANTFNTFTGFNAAAGSSGSQLTHYGYRAGLGDRGNFNTFNGYESGLGNFFGTYNSFFGAWSGMNNSDGEMNTFIGAESGRDNENGYSNTYVGFRAGLSSSDSYNNTAIGSSSLLNNNIGFGNVAVGEGSLFSITDRDLNIGIGNSSGRNLSDMTSMIILGSNANDNVAHAHYSVVAGNNAFRTGDLVEYSILMGDGVAQNLENSWNSIVLGRDAVANGQNIVESIIIGDQAAMNVVNSGASVVIGDRCVENLQGLENSVTIGAEIGFGSTAISTAQSVVIGWRALPNWTTGGSNIVIGTESAPNLDAGRDNVIIGTTGAINFTDDEQNIILGNNTEKIGTNGVLRSTIIGQEALVDAGTGGGIRQEASAIGYQSEVCDDFTMVLGKHSTANPTTVVIGDCEPNFATPGNGDFEVVSPGFGMGEVYADAYNSPSDRRLKKNIEKIGSPLKIISNLNGYYYNYISDDNEEDLRSGVIAQELEEHFPSAVKKAANNYYVVNYDAVIPLLLQGIKVQHDTVSLLKEEVNELKKEIKEIKRELGFSKPPASDIDTRENELAGSLKQNAPNPFSEETVISYTINGEFNQGTISILDFNGQQIKDFRIHETLGEVRFNGSGYPSGIYFYGLFVDNELLDIKKMIIAK